MQGNKIKRNLKVFIFFSIFCFYSVNLINNLRGIGLYYNIFCEFFLLMALFTYVASVQSVNIKYVILSLILLTIIACNTLLRTRYLDDMQHKGPDGGGMKEICIGFPHLSYHNKMDLEKFYKVCSI